MRPVTTSYLVKKTHLKQKALTLRIPQHVHEAFNIARERADKAGFLFDIQAVVVEALERAVDRVDRELQVVEQGEQGSQMNGDTGIHQPVRPRRQRGMLKPVEVPEVLK